MTLDYASRQISAVWKMAWNAPDWADDLDRSVDGVFRSFWAMTLAAPFVLLSLLSLRRAAERFPTLPQSPLLEAPIFVAAAIEFAGFFADWGASLAALIFAARALGAAKHAADAIVGFNWLQVLVAVVQSVPLVAANLGREVAGLLFLPALGLVIALYWGVLRRSLRTSPAATAALILLLSLVGLVANALVTGIGAALL